jgi:alkanesulfonate monooxygenase SsuD/methylene tetrahydromethanopterin reductase-like flavin-dependent oxidoreductase (luciferase family)
VLGHGLQAVDGDGAVHQSGGIHLDRLGLKCAEMLVEPCAPQQIDAVAGLKDRLLLARAATAHEAEMAAMPNYSPEMVRKNLVIGEPDEVITRLKGYEALGFDQFSIWIDSGLSHERKKKSLDLFIRHVMPAFA